MSEKQYVVFNLGKEEFGIDIMRVKEIIPYKESTNVPKTPDFIDGIINYRGGVIPIINLKKRFDMNTTEITKETRIIVINLEDKEIGFVVDQASQTIRLNDDNIEPAPGVISQIDKRFITAIGKIDEERLLILLNLHNVLTDKEKSKIREMEM